MGRNLTSKYFWYTQPGDSESLSEVENKELNESARRKQTSLPNIHLGRQRSRNHAASAPPSWRESQSYSSSRHKRNASESDSDSLKSKIPNASQSSEIVRTPNTSVTHATAPTSSRYITPDGILVKSRSKTPAADGSNQPQCGTPGHTFNRSITSKNVPNSLRETPPAVAPKKAKNSTPKEAISGNTTPEGSPNLSRITMSNTSRDTSGDVTSKSVTFGNTMIIPISPTTGVRSRISQSVMPECGSHSPRSVSPALNRSRHVTPMETLSTITPDCAQDRSVSITHNGASNRSTDITSSDTPNRSRSLNPNDVSKRSRSLSPECGLHGYRTMIPQRTPNKSRNVMSECDLHRCRSLTDVNVPRNASTRSLSLTHDEEYKSQSVTTEIASTTTNTTSENGCMARRSAVDTSIASGPISNCSVPPTNEACTCAQFETEPCILHMPLPPIKITASGAPESILKQLEQALHPEQNIVVPSHHIRLESRILLCELMDYAYAVERLIIPPDQFTGKKSPELLELLNKYAHELNRKHTQNTALFITIPLPERDLYKDLPSLQVTIAMSVLLLDELIAHARCCQPTKSKLLLKNVIFIETTNIDYQVSSYVDRHMKGIAPGSQVTNTAQTSQENTNREQTSSDAAEDVSSLCGNLCRWFVACQQGLARFCSDCRKRKDRYSEAAVMDTVHSL